MTARRRMRVLVRRIRMIEETAMTEVVCHDEAVARMAAIRQADAGRVTWMKRREFLSGAHAPEVRNSVPAGGDDAAVSAARNLEGVEE
jgi:hypothetical protein